MKSLVRRREKQPDNQPSVASSSTFDVLVSLRGIEREVAFGGEFVYKVGRDSSANAFPVVVCPFGVGHCCVRLPGSGTGDKFHRGSGDRRVGCLHFGGAG